MKNDNGLAMAWARVAVSENQARMAAINSEFICYACGKPSIANIPVSVLNALGVADATVKVRRNVCALHFDARPAVSFREYMEDTDGQATEFFTRDRNARQGTDDHCGNVENFRGSAEDMQLMQDGHCGNVSKACGICHLCMSDAALADYVSTDSLLG